ncbi:kelch repeat-containing protein [Fulvivirga lutimaris]|uniref:kelch repeat-containing protein n=1 Tax=Fulvivirga lutimaris TaxID=1819566 RepID=UPI0012BD1D18|nr:kelch repeat-containing protein [Fulvivirga lutimaris]MTI37971.1 hypothetical protein [Fulvivirga lutimaris]
MKLKLCVAVLVLLFYACSPEVEQFVVNSGVEFTTLPITNTQIINQNNQYYYYFDSYYVGENSVIYYSKTPIVEVTSSVSLIDSDITIIDHGHYYDRDGINTNISNRTEFGSFTSSSSFTSTFDLSLLANPAYEDLIGVNIVPYIETNKGFILGDPIVVYYLSNPQYVGLSLANVNGNSFDRIDSRLSILYGEYGNYSELYPTSVSISEYGVVYNTSATPTINDSKQVVGTSITLSQSNTTPVENDVSINGLDDNKAYYIRPYAIDSDGKVYYGSEQTAATIIKKGWFLINDSYPGRSIDDEGISFYHEGKIYYGGGKYYNGVSYAHNDEFFQYDIATNEWRNMGSEPTGIGGFETFTIGDMAYVLVNYFNYSYPVMWAYNIQTNGWEQLVDPPFLIRDDFATFSSSSNGYVVGGQFDYNDYTSEVWRFNQASGSWTQLAQDYPDGAAIYLLASSNSEKAFVGYGQNTNSPNYNAIEFDFATETWGTTYYTSSMGNTNDGFLFAFEDQFIAGSNYQLQSYDLINDSWTGLNTDDNQPFNIEYYYVHDGAGYIINSNQQVYVYYP